MNFRARVALAAALAVAIAVALASAAAYAIARNQLRLGVDRNLEARAAGIVAAPVDTLLRERRFPPPPFGSANVYIQLVEPDGTADRPGGETVPLPVDDEVRAVAAGTRDAFFTDARVEGVHLRILTTQLYPGVVALQVARPLTEIDAVLARLRWILLLVALGGIALGGGLGLLVSRTSLTPVRRLTRAAEQVAATHELALRVDVEGDDELARLAVSFNAMVAALADAVRAQRQLVADASHELRTPLTSVRTNVELLARVGALSEEERAAILHDIRSELEELTALVGDVVELAREGETELPAEDVRLDLLVAGAVERARRRAPDVTFHTDLSETLVHGAPTRLDRAVANLLENAVKWSPPGGPVEVRVAAGEVSVRDHGPGIDDADLPFVFDRFYRAPGARGLPGSGLGLAIVRRVAESHGGSVVAQRAEGGGTLVRISLPDATMERPEPRLERAAG
ncbi:MAG TPA: HAMP domain-containing sensor histidine kinase [Gaiellaceae bacterium]|nr:HAMP domain-containing sensor histidine kinase [Gaiellaceae bacterium]